MNSLKLTFKIKYVINKIKPKKMHKNRKPIGFPIGMSIDIYMSKKEVYLMNNNILNSINSIDEISDEIINTFNEYCNYGSIGTLNAVIDALEGLRIRIELGQKIKYNGKYLTLKTYQELINDNFCEYVLKGVFKNINLKDKVFFKLENTKEGMNLIYTGENSNKFFKWIADLDEETSLIRALPNNVVYVRTINKNGISITPFVTEHNSCYYYDEINGKIKEYFEK